MKESKNYKFRLPEDGDIINVSDLTGNFELIDKLLGVLSTANKFICGTEDLKVNCDNITASKSGLFTHSECPAPATAGANYFVNTINLAFDLYLDDVRELSANGSWNVNIYPAGAAGMLYDVTGIMMPIHLCYDVITKSLHFEINSDFYATDTVVDTDGNMLRIPIGIVEVDIPGGNTLVINSSELYPEGSGSGVYIPGLVGTEV